MSDDDRAGIPSFRLPGLNPRADQLDRIESMLRQLLARMGPEQVCRTCDCWESVEGTEHDGWDHMGRCFVNGPGTLLGTLDSTKLFTDKDHGCTEWRSS